MDEFTEYYINKKVVYVTSLEDSGPGTLRDIIKDPEPKVVLFKVAGIIHLQKRLWLGNPYITIDGSSAPGPVIIYNEMFYVRAHNVLVRYITVASNRTDLVVDSIWLLDTFNVIIDHVTALFGSDETFSVTNCDDVIISNCIIANTLDVNDHAFCCLLRGKTEYSTIVFRNNLLANCASRNPSYGQGNFLVRNNLIYNYGYRASYSSTTDNSVVIMMNNYYKPGPNTTHPKYIFRMPYYKTDVSLYVDNNFIQNHTEETEDNTKSVLNPDNGLVILYEGKKLKIDYKVYMDTDPTNDTDTHYKGKKLKKKKKKRPNKKLKNLLKNKLRVLEKMSKSAYAKKAMDRENYFDNYEEILNYVGNSINRSYLDNLIIDQVRNNTGTFASFNEINFEDAVQVVHDKDMDGIPDSVEEEFGLDQYNNIDAQYIDENGVINLQKYLKTFSTKEHNPSFFNNLT